MRIPDDATIPLNKLTHYLLMERTEDDKSKFLRLAGFTSENPHDLLAAIRSLAAIEEAQEDKSNEYGVFFNQSGKLHGLNGLAINVILIWIRLHLNGEFRFVTLKPGSKSP